MFVDGSTNREGSGVDVVLESPRKEKVLRALKLDFPVSNNEAKYKTLSTELRMARNLGIRVIQVFCDSKLVSAHINTEFEAKEPKMVAYLQLAKDLVYQFESFEITHIPRIENAKADD